MGKELTSDRFFAAALDHFSDRLLAGAQTDLLELAKISFIKSRTAWVYLGTIRSDTDVGE